MCIVASEKTWVGDVGLERCWLKKNRPRKPKRESILLQTAWRVWTCPFSEGLLLLLALGLIFMPGQAAKLCLRKP